MTNSRKSRFPSVALLGISALSLAACNGFDPDLRRYGGGGFSTTTAASQAAQARPSTDSRGVITYPNYQVAIAQDGDSVANVATRVGVNAEELARFNAVPMGTQLRRGEVLVLPTRVAAGPVGTPGVPVTAAPGDGIDVTAIASSAIDRAQSGGTTQAQPVAAKPASAPVGEPIRHRVQRGETAYSIARLYNVNVKAMADWNGLGADLAVREGQYLLIPVAATGSLGDPVTQPGQGSPTPVPPSASTPLPDEKTTPSATPVATPPSPEMSAERTSASRLGMPVEGKIIRAYQKKKNDGIDIGAAAGTTVKSAGDGTVAAITKDTDQVPILVIRHDGNLLTVYANIDGIKVAKGDKVKRGQPIAVVRASDPAFLHFEVRQGLDSTDPVPFLK
ncbi:peptidoglycan DD-metalloendopeptidase family protein [Defluviimonas sp. WL0002]|uniref:Peptidoglycan DD-metalloendopeptidase family protein n=1 Tax=Albidovulum marisflavi TaxID=2984159 RepID=A0ABT2ZFD1_9RHOB|nr:peptidoglycan DD-metalloendopeptidase family protein [Defluviimonas sp. WL0002]MCV2869816.1 peptidoglycan DD-metalloendopeptidase family protein [Defluviimonas sp. WL0002]